MNPRWRYVASRHQTARNSAGHARNVLSPSSCAPMSYELSDVDGHASTFTQRKPLDRFSHEWCWHTGRQTTNIPYFLKNLISSYDTLNWPRN
jgi:hypothetical protein